MSDFNILPEFAERIHWNRRGSCGNGGCTDPECCCSLCARPIGVPEEDPRWDEHSDYCDDCDLCRDRVPIMLFRGKGKRTQQASFHIRCFERMLAPTTSTRTAHSNLAASTDSTPEDVL